MGKLTYLVLHCTATPEGRDVTPEQILQWHLQGRGWSQVGYSGLFRKDGKLDILVPFDQDDQVDRWELTNGVKGINAISRHVVYAGGMTKDMSAPKDTRNAAQRSAMAAFVRQFVKDHPQIKVAGHNQFANKACPSFDVPDWCENIGIPEHNIYRPAA